MNKQRFTEEEIFKKIDKLIYIRKNSLNKEISDYEEIFSINDLLALKDKFRTQQGCFRRLDKIAGKELIE